MFKVKVSGVLISLQTCQRQLVKTTFGSADFVLNFGNFALKILCHRIWSSHLQNWKLKWRRVGAGRSFWGKFCNNMLCHECGHNICKIEVKWLLVNVANHFEGNFASWMLCHKYGHCTSQNSWCRCGHRSHAGQFTKEIHDEKKGNKWLLNL